MKLTLTDSAMYIECENIQDRVYLETILCVKEQGEIAKVNVYGSKGTGAIGRRIGGVQICATLKNANRFLKYKHKAGG